MDTRIIEAQQHIKDGDFRSAILKAAKVKVLGSARNDILDAATALHNPRWVKSLGKSPEEVIAKGLQTLRQKYGI